METWNNNYFYIEKGISSDLDIKLSNIDTSIIPLKKDEISSIKTEFNINKNLSAPITLNDKIGNFRIYTNSRTILEGDILSNQDIKKKNVFYYLNDFFKNYSNILNDFVQEKTYDFT